MEDNMVYCGPLKKGQCQLLSFKVAVLCDIMKDPHSAKFQVSGNVLMYPFCNPSLVAGTHNNEVTEIGHASSLGLQKKSVLGAVPASILKHCLLRYILDIGETGLYRLVRDLETGNWLNCSLEKHWGKTVSTCRDQIAQFFQSHMSPENSLLVVRCMVLAHKTALVEFLDKLDMCAIHLASQRYSIPSDFVCGMKDRVKQIHSVLSTFEPKDLLSF